MKKQLEPTRRARAARRTPGRVATPLHRYLIPTASPIPKLTRALTAGYDGGKVWEIERVQ